MTTRLASDATDKVKKPGEWNLMVYKSRATRWDYFLQNPQGGGFGSTSYTSAQAAITAGTSRVNWQGATRVWVIQAVWDAEAEDYKVVKTAWMPVGNPLRAATIRLAASMPKGSTERKALLEVLAADKTAAWRAWSPSPRRQGS